MTAIIGILNKSAVAIAADSAVTVGTGRSTKVYNHAHKIFNLSVGNPIAVMIYNSAEFAGTPWETIIKEYRNQNRVKAFDHVYQYRDDFVYFLKRFRSKFRIDNEEETIGEITIRALNTIENELSELISEAHPDPATWNALSVRKRIVFYQRELSRLLKDDLAYVYKNDSLEEIKDFSDSKLTVRFRKSVNAIANQFLAQYGLEGDPRLLKHICKLVVACSKREIFLEPWTGLVFTGFGNEEIFPSLFSVKIGGTINNRIRYSVDKDYAAISNTYPAAITPFAQTDIMRTFVEGIDPLIRDSIPPTFEAALNEFKDYVLKSLDYSTAKEKKLKTLLAKSIPRVVSILVSRLEELRSNSHINPMLQTISSLSKEDITEMAESLINLTYLKRRATFGEESVGGPVDVAVITKGDGFIWIKRKHYFRPDLNLNYVSRVNKPGG